MGVWLRSWEVAADGAVTDLGVVKDWTFTDLLELWQGGAKPNQEVAYKVGPVMGPCRLRAVVEREDGVRLIYFPMRHFDLRWLVRAYWVALGN